MEKLKILPPPMPNRDKFPFTGTIKYKGLTIDVENLDGSVREGVGPGGKKWKTPFVGTHYGEIRDSKGSDGDALDVYLKNPPDDTDKAFIVHQNFPGNHPSKAGQYDEDKVILGVKDSDAAKALYLHHYDRKDFLRSVTEMPLSKFKNYAFGENKGEKVAAEIGTEKARELGSTIGIDWEKSKFPVEQLQMGIGVEREHGSELGANTDVGGDDDLVAARIAWAHLKELPDYYTRLKEMEAKGERAKEADDAEDDTEDSERGGKPIDPGLVAEWLRKNPNPDDTKVHALAEEKGYSTDELEAALYRFATKAVKSGNVGKANRREPSSFIQMQLKEGSVYEDVYNFGVKLALRQLGLNKESAESVCKTPGEKIRSKGQGRGLARGGGKGPMGVPIAEKLRAFAKKSKKG